MRLAVDIVNGGSHVKAFAHSADNVVQGRKVGNWQLAALRRRSGGMRSRKLREKTTISCKLRTGEP
jgi:hypothetical protein